MCLNILRQKPHDDVGEERCAEHRLAEQGVARIHGGPQTGHALGTILEAQLAADIGRHSAYDGNLGDGGRNERTDDNAGAQQRQYLPLKGGRADTHDAQCYTRQQTALGNGGADAHGGDKQPYRGAGKAAEGSRKRDNAQKYLSAAHDEYADKIGNYIGDPVDDRPDEQSHSPHSVLLQPFGCGNERDGETSQNSQYLKYNFLSRCFGRCQDIPPLVIVNDWYFRRVTGLCAVAIPNTGCAGKILATLFTLYFILDARQKRFYPLGADSAVALSFLLSSRFVVIQKRYGLSGMRTACRI